ncbi:hypothetical protein AURDEDRAFT_109842 [Auricularia subglabra TFB-10046 SS5]|nr:hypothetical protein AURDEDRAFT_109842 [Auricularia subglabra TFB-10046 SS5]
MTDVAHAAATTTTATLRILVPSPETAKDQRRRGAEIDMAHKTYDRAKGHFHSRKARSTCTACHGRGWTGPPRTARAPVPAGPAVEEAQYVPHWEREVVERERSIDGWLCDEPDHVPAGAPTLADCVTVKPRRARKGVAADFEIVPNAAHNVLVLEDDGDSSRSPQAQWPWEIVDSDDSETNDEAHAPRSYAGVVQGRS